MFNVRFADIGEGIHEGIIYKMNAIIGKKIEEGDVLFLVETDKVTAEISSPVSGEIVKVNARVGDKIEVGNTIVTINDGILDVRSNMPEREMLDEGNRNIQEVKNVEVEISEEETGASVVGVIEVSSELIASSQEVENNETRIKSTKKILATPVSRKLAKDLNIDIGLVTGTGPVGRVMKADIYAAKEEQDRKVKSSIKDTLEPETTFMATKTFEENEIVRKPMSMVRKAIAKKIVKSRFTIPHTVVMDEVDVTELVEFRESIKLMASETGVNITYLSLIVKAVTRALKENIIVNSYLDEEKEEIILKYFVNMGIAVDTSQGLMVPVIKRTDHMSIIEIATAIKDISSRAKEKQLKLEEIKNSTFTITNYGSFGSSFGVPIINYPDAAVLGVGAIVKKPVVIDDEIVIRSMLPLSMSFDHRIMDGADAGRFMATLKQLLSNPKLLLLN